VCDISSRDLARNALKIGKETTHDLLSRRRRASMAYDLRKAPGRRDQHRFKFLDVDLASSFGVKQVEGLPDLLHFFFT